MAESEEELKSLLMKVKEETGESGLVLSEEGNPAAHCRQTLYHLSHQETRP